MLSCFLTALLYCHFAIHQEATPKSKADNKNLPINLNKKTVSVTIVRYILATNARIS